MMFKSGLQTISLPRLKVDPCSLEHLGSFGRFSVPRPLPETRFVLFPGFSEVTIQEFVTLRVIGCDDVAPHSVEEVFNLRRVGHRFCRRICGAVMDVRSHMDLMHLWQ